MGEGKKESAEQSWGDAVITVAGDVDRSLFH